MDDPMKDDGCRDPRCPNRRTLHYAEVVAFAAAVICIAIIVLLVVLLLSGCATKKPAAPAPQFAGVASAAQSLGGTLETASASGQTALSKNADAREIAEYLDGKTLILLDQ